MPTLDGPVKLRVPEGTQSGKVMRLRGKGVQDVRGYGRGDQLVTLRVVTPTAHCKTEGAIAGVRTGIGPGCPNGKQRLFERMKDALR